MAFYLKLGKRLQQLNKMITQPYQHIWDCCCDHGLLGMTLISRQAAPEVHFIDIVPELMQALDSKLQHYFSAMPQSWTTHCLDVQNLPMNSYEQKNPGKHLVIIAGVGGDLTTQLMEQIYRNNPTTDIDFLLCPVHHQFTLRQKLIALNFSLIDEVLITENKRFYEILLVSTNLNKTIKTRAISAVGDKIWRSDTPENSVMIRAYLTKTLQHYRRIQLNPQRHIQVIIDAYQTKIF